MTAPLQALAMNWSVSISGMRPRESVGVAVPPTWTTQQLMLAPRMPLTVECIVVGLEKPEIPSVNITRPLRALLGSSCMASVPALTIPSRLVSPGSCYGREGRYEFFYFISFHIITERMTLIFSLAVSFPMV